MSKPSFKNIFLKGPIPVSLIASQLEAHQSRTDIGAHSLFLGQVRADELQGQRVAAIEYTAYEEMALAKMHEIREALFTRYPLTCLHVYHSLGTVPAGALCLFVFASSPRRKAAIDACSEAVERIKAELPIWGRELFEDASFQWKVNS